jgi:phosphate transport system permease protein
MTALPTTMRLRSTGYTRRKVVNAVMLGLTGVATLLAVVPLVWIIAYVALEGGRFLNLDFFTQLPTPVGVPGGGIANAIVGSAMVVGIACLIAIPISLIAAFYVVDHPNTALGVAVRFGTDVLSGVPSIVIGIFASPLSSCRKSISLRSRVGLRWPW